MSFDDIRKLSVMIKQAEMMERQAKSMERQAKALERIADALEREPEVAELGEIDVAGVIDWQDALRVMKTTCIQADECGPGCPMNEWCQSFNKEGSAPAKWEPIENEEASK